MKFRKVHSMLIAAILTCSLAVTPVFAAPASNNQASLQEKKAAAQNEANSLQSQLNTLMGKMNELEGADGHERSGDFKGKGGSRSC